MKTVELVLGLAIIGSVYAASVKQEETPFIIGGHKAERGQFPYQVQIQYLFQHFCGGTIIDSNWILTSAACVTSSRNSYGVIINQYNKNSDEGSERRYGIAEIVRHPQFDENTLKNDIALVKLDAPILFDDFAQPIALPEYLHVTPAETMGTLTGWGSTTEGGLSPIYLRFVQVPVWSPETCSAAYPDMIHPSQFCAASPEGGKDSCTGDGGGPLVCDDLQNSYICGVVSAGTGCGRPGFPTVYTKVSHYVDWIKATIQ